MAAVEPTVPAVPAGSAPGEKGLRGDALGLMSSIVIGVASTAPGYSLAASLGLVVAAVGFASPAIMWLAFVPMLLVATSYYYLNRVDPDCGTTFSWATKAFGPWVGWIGGWAIISARPADAILAVEEEVGAGLIVVGTAGENPISGALLGSIVRKLVQRSAVPLLVVPTQEG